MAKKKQIAKRVRDGSKTESYSFRLTPELKQAIPAAAEKAGLNQNAYVHEVLEAAVKDNPLVLRRRIEKLEGQLKTIKEAVRSI